jgi:hypothetical protein
MLADMAMKVEAARLLTYTAAAKAERGDPNLTFIRRRRQVLRLRRGDGGHHRRGAAVRRLRLHQDFPVERMMRDAKITQIYEGTNQIQRMVMARGAPVRWCGAVAAAASLCAAAWKRFGSGTVLFRERSHWSHRCMTKRTHPSTAFLTPRGRAGAVGSPALSLPLALATTPRHRSDGRLGAGELR